jgi:uncharacterized protein YceH (UPF0502 family)
MPLQLDRTERRIVGSLLEKEMTVPDAYPLTINSLLLACNQSSNRDPEMHLQEFEVTGAVRALMQKGWVAEMELSGARTRRYAHLAREQLGVDDVDLAILAELLLRGPQSPQELKTRASRMKPVATPEDVERRLQALAARPVPYVRFLGRRPGVRVPRWEHLLGKPGETPPPPPEPVVASTGPAASAAPQAAPAAAADPLAALAARVEALERTVAELKRSLGV